LQGKEKEEQIRALEAKSIDLPEVQSESNDIQVQTAPELASKILPSP